MPPPMTPAPSTAAERTAVGSAPRRPFPLFEASMSLNKCTRFFETGDTASSPIARASASSPASRPRSTPTLTTSIARNTAVVTAALGHHFLARLVEDDPPTDGVLLEEKPAGAAAPGLASPAVEDRLSEASHAFEKIGIGQQGVDEAELEGFLGPQCLARENDVEGRREADAARQPRASSPAGHDAQLGLRQADAHVLAVRDHDEAGGERQLGAAPDAGTADRGHGRERQSTPGGKELLALTRALLGLGRVGDFGNAIDIGAGDEDPLLAREEDQTADVVSLRELGHDLRQLLHDGTVEDVDAGARKVEGQRSQPL